MSTHKHFDKICYVVLAVTLVITILFMNGKSLGIVSTESESSNSDMFTTSDFNCDWDTSSAEDIVLSDDTTTFNGSNYYISDGDVYITSSGYYVISGELSNGSIIVNADSSDKIWIMLNGVTINCDDDAVIRVEQAGKVFLTLANETENNITSGEQYNSDVISSGVDGVIYSRDDLTINGNGTLNVTAQYKHGIVGNDDLIITGGNITISAVEDAIHANDSVRIANAEINISAGDDGITVSNDDESAYLYIESGKINIDSCYEGLEAIDITIVGGDIDISPTDDGINANGSGQNSVINIEGGDITIINPDGKDADGIDSNKDIYISGGNLFISVSNDGSSSAIDYGSENNGVCEISGGTVLACGSSGMAEGFDSTSTQGFIMYTTSATANTEVSVKDADGNVLISNEIPCAFSSVVVSTPEMSVGDTCTIIIGDNEEEITIDNSSSSGGFGQGGMNIDIGANGGNPQNDANNEENPNDNQGDAINGAGDGNAQPQMPDSTDGSEQLEMPNGTDSGEQPQMPDGANSGEQQQMPNGTDGGGEQLQMPDDTGDGSEQPQKPNDSENFEGQDDFQNFGDQQNGAQPEKPSDDNTEMPDNIEQPSENGDEQPNGSGDNGDGKQQNFDNNSQQFNNGDFNFGGENPNSDTETSSYTLTNTDIIYISVSVAVLILGCIIAIVAKRRKS